MGRAHQPDLAVLDQISSRSSGPASGQSGLLLSSPTVAPPCRTASHLIDCADMKRWIVVSAAACALAIFVRSQQTPPRPTPAAPVARSAFRITFGERQERETDYSGT